MGGGLRLFEIAGTHLLALDRLSIDIETTHLTRKVAVVICAANGGVGSSGCAVSTHEKNTLLTTNTYSSILVTRCKEIHSHVLLHCDELY